MRFSFVALIVIACLTTSAFGQAKKTDTDTVKSPEPAQAKGTPEAEKLKGRRVMVTEHRAEIKTREGGVVWRADLGEVLTVTIVNQDWLWIFEHQGWLHINKVLPHETAVYEMNARIKKSPRAENYGLRGNAHMNLGNLKEAIKDFSVVVRRNPKDPGAYVNRGNAYRALGKNKEAIDDYSKAVNLDLKHFLAMNNRAIVQTTLKHYDLALKDLNAAVILNTEYSEAHNNRGIVLRELKRYEDAVADFSQAVKIYPRYVAAYVNRAEAYLKLKKYKEAREDFSRAVMLSPNDGNTMNDFAWFLATCPDKEFRDGEKAVDMAQTAVDLTDSKSWDALDTYGAAYAEVGKFAPAERWAEKALDIAPENEQAQIRKHLISYKKRKPIRD